VAERKLKALLSCGARVTLVSPELRPAVRDLVEQNGIDYREDLYQPHYLEQRLLVFCATDDPQVNRQAALDCQTRGILVNCTSEPDICSFFVPAVHREGSLSLAVSTGGNSPALAARIRDQLADFLTEDFQAYLEFLSESRQKILERVRDGKRRRALLEELAADSFYRIFKTAASDQAAARVEEMIVALEGQENERNESADGGGRS
jgi:precorrin-2 dehydrogenase/sirohydrochlorin ferrochelatase